MAICLIARTALAAVFISRYGASLRFLHFSSDAMGSLARVGMVVDVAMFQALQTGC
jgi:hypothetical protein